MFCWILSDSLIRLVVGEFGSNLLCFALTAEKHPSIGLELEVEAGTVYKIIPFRFKNVFID